MSDNEDSDDTVVEKNDNNDRHDQHLKNVRAGYKARITYFRNKLNRNELTSLGDLESALNRIHLIYSKLDDVQFRLEMIDTNYAADRDHWEDEFGFVEATLLNKTRELNNKTVVSASKDNTIPIDNNLHASVSLKLPDINLPSFDGSELGWLDFRSLFTDLIHTLTNLSNIAKFHYLVSCVRNGKAYKYIQSFSISNDNYPVAWKALTDHYNNETFITKSHMKELYAIQKPNENPSSLRNFIDTACKHYNALRALKIPVENWDLILIHHLCERLDEKSHIEIIKKSPVNVLLTFDAFIEILKLRCKILEGTNSLTSNSRQNRPISSNDNFKRTSSQNYANKPKGVLVAVNVNCIFCKKNHTLDNCVKFKDSNITPQDRLAFVKKNDYCTNCLSGSHRVNECKKASCSLCPYKHNTLLHFRRSYENNTSNNSSSAQKTSIAANSTVEIPTSSSNSSNNSTTNVQNFCSSTSSETHAKYSQIVLATAIVSIQNSSGNQINCRALLDSGSQANFITQRMVNLLNLRTSPTQVNIYGINGSVSTLTKRVDIMLESKNSDFSTVLSCLVQNCLSEHVPSFPIQFDFNRLPPGIQLADPTFFESNSIDLLIGAEIYADILINSKPDIFCDLSLQNTVFGYVVIGKLKGKAKLQDSLSNLKSFFSLEELNQNIEKFWSIENFDTSLNLSLEEKLCESHYSQSVVRTESGRYSVALPVKPNIEQLGESSNRALKQFYGMENRLLRNPELRKMYVDFMTEYIDLQHMERVENSDTSTSTHDKVYYLPHHPVLRDTSTTTKLRVVFNASSKTSSTLSLNDCLMVGATVQSDLRSIIMRFRKHRYVITGDITKMYRQILVHPNQQDLQRIWWRDSIDKPVSCYKLRTVTYGTASAPFLAIRTLFQLADDEILHFPTASKVLKEDFYVDDVLTGSDTEQNTIKLKNDLVALLALGGFELRKLQSNNPNVVSDSEHTQSKPTCVLGMNWDPKLDVFQLSFDKCSSNETFTKRVVLSEIAQLFDPLGFCAPVVFLAKCFMQTLWSTKLEWDDELPSNLREFWNEFKIQLSSVDKICIPRCIVPPDPKFIEIHAFGDASNKGFGSVIYIRTIDHSNNCSVYLITSKSRVSPLKVQTIPRLELCAALLTAQLAQKVITVMDIQFSSIYFWSDSEITLYRIKSIPSRFQIFVANRISQIQDLTSQDDWYYVPTSENPADLVSRGLMLHDFVNTPSWFKGPQFINDSVLRIPTQPEFKVSVEDLELRKPVVQVKISTSTNDLEILHNVSNLKTLLRIFGYIRRFINNIKLRLSLRQSDPNAIIPLKILKITKEVCDSITPLSTIELDNAMLSIVKLIQHNSFRDELRNLERNNPLSQKSKLISLCPFLDETGLIRVGGRLANSDLTFDQKHQLLLPSDHSFIRLLVHTEHLRLMHAGPQSLLYSLRQRFWIINGRNLCRIAVHRCIICARTRPKIIHQIMGQLPANRVKPSRPFETSGVDFCGPFITVTKYRSKLTIKAYVAIFVCFASKAVHMEVVPDLTTEAFIACLRRFVGRRGYCMSIFSDNATNFISAKTELKELRKLFKSEYHQNEVIKYCIDHGITWNTIPPRSPHFGGLWEAAVKSAKHHLKRVIGNTSYTKDHLETLIVQVESCLNSRPIGYMSEDPNDYESLTPGHFLIGQPLTALPDPSLSHLNFNKLNMYQKIQMNFQTFWKRWSHEYLSQLQQRTKWTQQNNIVKVGDLVILREDNVPPLKWPMARVIQIHSGDDGFVRVVTVKTAHSEFKRAISRICPLPVETDTNFSDDR